MSDTPSAEPGPGRELLADARERLRVAAFDARTASDSARMHPRGLPGVAEGDVAAHSHKRAARALSDAWRDPEAAAALRSAGHTPERMAQALQREDYAGLIDAVSGRARPGSVADFKQRAEAYKRAYAERASPRPQDARQPIEGELTMATPTKEEQANRDRRETGRWEAMRDRGAGIVREQARQEKLAAKADKPAPREKGGGAPKV